MLRIQVVSKKKLSGVLIITGLYVLAITGAVMGPCHNHDTTDEVYWCVGNGPLEDASTDGNMIVPIVTTSTQ